MPNYSEMDKKDFVFIPVTPSEQDRKEISDFIRKDKAQSKSLKISTLPTRKKQGSRRVNS